MNQIIHCNPRFSSLLVCNSDGRERWRKTAGIDLDRHIIVFRNPISTPAESAIEFDDKAAVNDYLAELSTSSGDLPVDKPLWEVHLLIAHNCCVFRIHHALGDEVSLMSLLLATCRKAADGEKISTFPFGQRDGATREKGWWGLVIGFLTMLWFSLVYVVEFGLRSFWVCDQRTVINNDDGVKLWPRKLATARFKLQDMKLVKKSVPNVVMGN